MAFGDRAPRVWRWPPTRPTAVRRSPTRPSRRPCDPGVVMCGAEQRLPVVAATMASHAIHMVVVPSAHGGPALAITDLDLLHAELGGRLGETAGDIARDPMAAVAPSASLEHAIVTMATLDARAPAGVRCRIRLARGRALELRHRLRAQRPRPATDPDDPPGPRAAAGERDPAVGHHRRAGHAPGGDHLPARYATSRAGGADGRPAHPLHRRVGRRHTARRRRAPHVGAGQRHGLWSMPLTAAGPGPSRASWRRRRRSRCRRTRRSSAPRASWRATTPRMSSRSGARACPPVSSRRST